ncbi:hypothetical protein [Rhodococcus marinonascens]|uniref:hypothetical protein n=1 Tax=Rhodococcus marinonascens TaxID=38311 RepID=UPI000932E3C0|nr:hypothetical protein [Rhodococcus marinonascens]
MKGQNVRPAIYGAVGLLTGVIAVIPFQGAHESLLDFALRWYCLPLGVVVIAAVALGQLRDRAEGYVYAASTLFLIGGVVQLRWFVIALMYRDVAPIMGTVSAGFLLAAGAMILNTQAGEPAR